MLRKFDKAVGFNFLSINHDLRSVLDCRVVGEALNIQEIRAQCKFPTGQSSHNFLEMS